MKKILLGLIIGVMVALPIGATADYVVHTPHAKYIYDVGNSVRVDVFDDRDNKCYVAYYHHSDNYDDRNPAISCVRAKP